MLPLKILAAWLALDVLLLSPLWIRAFRKPREDPLHCIGDRDERLEALCRRGEGGLFHTSRFAQPAE